MEKKNTPNKMEEKRKRIVLALVLSSYLVVGIDGSLVITAIAQIAEELHMDNMAMSWVQNAYVLAFGGFMLAGGRLGDIYGRKLTFCTSIVLFCIGSLGAGLSQTAWMIILSRFVQGVGSAAMAPAALGLIVDYFQGRERVKVVAWYGSISGLGLCVGLVLGGAITSYTSWRWGFLVNIPITLLMLAYAFKWLYEGGKSDGHLDFSGTILSAMGMFAFVYAIDGAKNTWVWMMAAIICLLFFIKAEQRATLPIVPANLFHSRNRCNGYLSRLMLIGALMGYNFSISVFLQGDFGFTPLQTGCAFLPMTLTTFCGALAVPRLVERHGNVLVLLVGLALLVVGFMWLTDAKSSETYIFSVCLPMIFIGFGQGLAMSPLTNLGIEGVDSKDTGAASGFVNVMHQIGGAVGLSLMVSTSEGIINSTLRFSHCMVIATLLILSALSSTLFFQYTKFSTKMKATLRCLHKGTYLFTLMLFACSPKVKAQNNQSLVIQEQGSFAFGGTVLTDSIGHQFHGDHAYVFYQKPVHPYRYPVVMIHGIHEGPKTWETTPDGREGFQNLLLRKGFSTYNVTMPRRGNAGRSTIGMMVKPEFDEQTWYTKWRIGVYPGYFDGVQFSRSKEALNQFMRQMTPETGPTDFEHNSSTIASLCDSLGGVILMPHSQGVMHTWKILPKTHSVKAVVALEGGGYFSFPTNEPRPRTNAEEGLEYIMVSPKVFDSFTHIPMLLIYGDNIPSSTAPTGIYELDVWTTRLSLARQWAEAVNRRGGDVTMVHLPEIGIKGNTHFPMSDLNNKEVLELICKWLKGKGLYTESYISNKTQEIWKRLN